MRLSVFLTLLFSAALPGAGTRIPVQVIAIVPLVAAVEGPNCIVLAPGATATITVRVATNVAWTLDVQSTNAFLERPATRSGIPGGANANRCEFEIRCASHAPGPQTMALIYTLMAR